MFLLWAHGGEKTQILEQNRDSGKKRSMLAVAGRHFLSHHAVAGRPRDEIGRNKKLNADKSCGKERDDLGNSVGKACGNESVKNRDVWADGVVAGKTFRLPE